MQSKITFNERSNDYLSMWAANAIAPASMHILCIALRYSKPENLESILFITFI